MDFWSARFLWQDPIIAAVVGAALLGYLGFFVVLRRIAFMSAALSQVSGLGVASAFWIGSFFGVEPHSTEADAFWFSPGAYALVFACAGAVLVSIPSRSRRVTAESVVALGYLAASAMVIVVLSSPRIAQEAHEIGDLLFGNAVVVKREHLVQLCLAAAGVFLVHLVFFKDFLFASYEPETARSMRYPVGRLDVLLHLTLAVSIAVSTRTLGALPVFAFLVLPSGAALLFAQRLRLVVVLSIAIAIVSAVLGYYLSWIWSMPTGPMMVALAAFSWVLATIKRVVEGRR
jgi:ABC-type Mn2+/Zn2+ transport system permease subunit